MTEQLTSLSITGASGSIYRLDKFLGGGQTAVVYQGEVTHCPTNLQRVGQACAVKLMVPGLDIATARRFGEEENILIELRSRLQQIDLKTLAPKHGDVEPLPIRAEQLIPEVWDQGEDLGRAFLVMTLAQGDPLDDLLRRGTFSQQKRESEHSTLWLIYQLLAVFQALHEGLHRSYLDFQPRNVFWQHKAGVITVIDWNLLSPVEPQPDAPIFVHDCQVIARLLYRLLVGVELPGNSPMQMVSPPGWQVLTRSTQLLLREILAPASREKDSTLVSPSSVLFTRIERELKKRTESADVLLLQARAALDRVGLNEKTDADKSEQGKAKTTESKRLLTLSQMQGIDEAEALLELVQQRGNVRMVNIKKEVEEILEYNSDKLSYIAQAQSFLRAGDFALARQFFADAIKEATQPASQLTAWRWWTLAKQLPTGAHLEETLQALDKILETTAEQPALGVETRNRLRSLPWPGVEVVADEMEQVERLQDLLTLGEADPVQRQKSETGEGKDASGTAGSIQERLKDAYEASNKALDALNALNNIRLPGKENSYADAIWLYLARVSGLNNTADVQAAVEKKRQKLRDRVKQLDYLEQISGQLTITKVLDLLDGRDPQIDRHDPELHRRVLVHTPDWFDGKDKKYSAYDAGLDRLLRTLTVLAPTQQEAIALYQRQLSLLQTAEYWVRQPVPVLLPEDANTKDTDGNVDSNAMGGDTAQRSVSLDYALTLLQEIETAIAHAPKRRQKLVESLVDGCIESRYTTALINTWLKETHSLEFKFLEHGLDYNKRVIEKQRALNALLRQIDQAEHQLTTLCDQEVAQRQSAEREAEQRRKGLAQELENIRADHKSRLAQDVQNQEKYLHSLAQQEQEFKVKIADLDAFYTKETEKRQKILDLQIAQRKQDLEGLNARYEGQRRELESDQERLRNEVNRKHNQISELASRIEKLREQEREFSKEVERLDKQKTNLEYQISEQKKKLDDVNQSLQEDEIAVAQLKANIKHFEKQHEAENARLEHLKTQASRFVQTKKQSSEDTYTQSVYPSNSPIAANAQPPNLPAFQKSSSLGSQSAVEITTILAEANDINPGYDLEERLSGKLLRHAQNIQQQFFKNSQYNKDINYLEELGHNFRLIGYLMTVTGRRTIELDFEKLREIYESVRLEFAKRWVKN